jgi:hypothetical protein
MAADVIFYEDINDTNLTNDFRVKKPEIYIMKHLNESTGTVVINTGSGNDTLTDTSASFTVNELVSTTGLNFLIRDDNSKLAIGKVTANTANTITFDENDMVLVEDGATTPTLTSGSYSYRVLQPSSKYAWGEYLGYSNDLTVNPEQETIEFLNGVPQQKIREDLIRNNWSVTASINSTRYNTEKAIFGGTQYGSQTSQSEFHVGTASFNTNYYQIAMLGELVDGRSTLRVFYKVKFRPNGEINLSELDYKPLPAQFPIFRDTLRDSTSVDMGFYRLSDS